MLPSKASSSPWVLNTPLSLTDTRNLPSLTDLSMLPSLQNYSHLHTNLLPFILTNKTKSPLSIPFPLPATPHLPNPLCTNFLNFLSSHVLSPPPAPFQWEGLGTRLCNKEHHPYTSSVCHRSRVALASSTIRHLTEAHCTHGAFSACPCPSAPGLNFPLPQARRGLASAPLSQDVQV